MQKKERKELMMIMVLLFMVSWIVGVLCASNRIPGWLFILPNFPFGILTVWMESTWVGAHYEMFGHTFCGEMISMLLFCFVVIAQSLFYFRLIQLLRNRKSKVGMT